MIDPDKLKYKVNYNHSLYNFKTGRYESKRYTSAINRLRPISGSARNVKGYYLLKHLKSHKIMQHSWLIGIRKQLSDVIHNNKVEG